MLELFFFILGLVNSVFLIFIFGIRRFHLDLLRRIGWTYLLLAIPAVYGIYLVGQEHKSDRYSVFLGIFLLFLFAEWMLDYVFKINFRENWKRNWKYVVPYLVLYYAMNYGFVVMPLKANLAWGIIMLCLFVIQIIANLRTHPKTSG
jgi:hypothetical protein